MGGKRTTPRGGSRHGVIEPGWTRDDPIVSEDWTRPQCRAIELSLGGGFLVLFFLEAIFGW